MKPSEKSRDIILICEDIRSLQNVGSLFRSADAFGVSQIFLCGLTGRPPRPEISKTALGADAWVPWEYRAAAWEVVRELRARGVLTLALEKTPASKPIREQDMRFPVAIVAGNEVRGVSKQVLEAVDAVAHIPMIGKKESL
ncbi:MAG: TrmH family RNA methyltransferase, partial [bacterium]|nr:TrmH family RNA methyltransferase [bacterium]